MSSMQWKKEEDRQKSVLYVQKEKIFQNKHGQHEINLIEQWRKN